MAQAPDDPASIPASVIAYCIIGGERRRCAITTDVVESAAGREHTEVIGRTVTAFGPDDGMTNGINCCLVHETDRPGDLYLLGCNHVYTRSSANRCRVLQSSCLRWEDTGSTLGNLVDWTRLFPPAPRFGMDAAIVAVEASGLMNGRVSHVWDGVVAPPPTFTVATGRGDRQATFIAKVFGQSFRYRCGKSMRLRAALKYRAPTREGDSGSPLIDEDGTLYGMHFYGQDDGHGFAIPAYALFDPQLFTVPIELAVRS